MLKIEIVGQQDGVEFMVKVKRAARRGVRKSSPRGTSKRKESKRRASGITRAAVAVSSESDMADVTVEDPFVSSSLSLHELFQRQTRQILDRSDLEEDQKQHILVAMSCPCCGAGAMSFTAKLRR
jgi:C4-type Zn-finger protein